MEENEKVVQEPIKKEKKGSYITGTIGAILGGVIASVPWILVYTLGNMIIAALAVLIAGGAFLGYKLFRGRIGKCLPVIIAVLSLLIVTITTLVVCPIILIAKEGLEVTIFNFKMIYSASEMKVAIIQDLAMSLLFTVIGIVTVIRSISIQIKKGATAEQLKFNNNAVIEEQRKEVKEKYEIIKAACTVLNCLDKEKAATKQEIFNELEMTHKIERKKAKKYFAIAKKVKVLIKYKGKFYYDETDEQIKIEKACNFVNEKGKSKTFLWILIIAVIIGIVAPIVMNNLGEIYTIPETDIEIHVSNSQLLCRNKEEIAQFFGEAYAQYYNFAILDNEEASKSEYEIYGTILNKLDIEEENDLNTLVKSDRDYVASYWGEEKTSQVSDIKLGAKDFKTYSYKYSNQAGSEFRAIIYLCETQDKYLWIDLYADGSFEVTRANDIMRDLFK